MWKPIFLFEVRYWFRGWMLWIFLLVVSLMVFSAVSSDHIHVGGVMENTHRNAPYVIESYYAIFCILALLMTTAFVNSAAARDFTSRTDQILFSTPIRKWDFVAGRFLGAVLVSVIPLLGISLGVLAGKYMPWMDPERWGAVNWTAHLMGVLAFAVPNTLLVAAILFGVAAWTRSTAASFLGALLLLTGYGIGSSLTSDLKNETLAALIDPFGVQTFQLMTKYWTVAEKNRQAIGFSGLLLWNRLIWLSVAGAVFALSGWRLSFVARSGRKLRKAIKEDDAVLAPAVTALPPLAVVPSPARNGLWTRFRVSLRTEFFGLVKSTSFVVILAAALLNTLPNVIVGASEDFGNRSFPVTYRMVELIVGSLYLFIIALVTYFAGVLAWKERDTGMDEIHDSLPLPEWLPYVSKLSALMIALFLIQLLVMGAGILTQAFSGYTRFQLGLYSSELLLMDYSWFLFLAVLAFFFHAVSPNKYVGYAAYIIFLATNAFIWDPLHVATLLVRFAGRPRYIYSDFFGYGPYLAGWLWFTLYWALFCGLLALATIALWRRGKETSWRHRLGIAGLRLRGPMRTGAVALATAFVITGGWIYYNTKILNHLRAEHDDNQIQADYEKTYKRYEGLPQPRVTDIRYKIDLYPETRNAVLVVDEEIRNKTAQPIAQLHFTLPPHFDATLAIPGSTLATNDSRLGYRIYRLSQPIQPGEARRIQLTVKSRTRGFENSVTVPQLAGNGTFFNNEVVPQLGYQPGRELEQKNDRKDFGLKERDPMPALERNCTAHCGDTYLSNNSDWVMVDTIISTSADQIAIAPGSLLGEWTSGGRRYFHYKLDHPEMNFYSFISARYQVVREQWKGLSVEIYYLKEHPWNVPRMRQAVKKSLDYYTANFSPYQHRQARIIEFPRIDRFAQAFPGTMPYSESIGFIADLRNPDDIDHVFWVVSHEMAHQWWAYQLTGANMQGATLLSETLAQYSSMMVLEKEYGRDMMRKFLKYNMDQYLRSRGKERLKERPLERVESSQGYIHYSKGAVVMYHLREMIGEQAVNRALRKVIARYAYAEPPYPTSYALVDALREETPPRLQYLVRDLFEEITLFSNRALTASATRRTDGKYDVTVEAESRKFKADEQGAEREVPVDDWIEVGAFAAPAKGTKYGKTLHRELVHVNAVRNTFHFTVDQKPDQAGIDPFQLLIDRVPDDNTVSATVR